MFKKIIASILISNPIFSSYAGDLFSDVQNIEQVAAFNENPSYVTGSSSKVPLHNTISPQIEPQYGIMQFQVARRLLKGRHAIIARMTPSHIGSYRQMAILSHNLRIVQNGIVHQDIYMNSGQPDGIGGGVYYENPPSSTVPVASNGNFLKVKDFILVQAGSGFNPSASFELRYSYNWDSYPSGDVVASVPAAPQLSASFQPSVVPMGGAYAVLTNTVNATALRMYCTGAAATNTSLPTGNQQLNATAVEVGQTDCVFTAENAAGTTSVSAVRTVNLPNLPAPTISSSLNTATILVGERAIFSWNASNATSISVNCNGSAWGSYTGTSMVNAIYANGSSVGPATCTAIATNASGQTATSSQTLAVTVLAPSITTSLSSPTVAVGSTGIFNWSATNAVSVTVNCTGAGAGTYTGPSLVNAIYVHGMHVGTAVCMATATNAAGIQASSMKEVSIVSAP